MFDHRADSRGSGEQFVEFTRILRKGTAVEQAEQLQRLIARFTRR